MAKKRKLSKGPKTEPDLDDSATHGEPSAAVIPKTDPSEDEASPSTELPPEANLKSEPAENVDGDNEEEEESDPASIQMLIEPFQKDQLIDLLRDAAVAHHDVLESILRIADSDTAHRKIFVHGLGWDATTETLRTAFSLYGEIEECKAVIDKVTGRAKGYGFILFKNRSAASRALKEPQKKIGNRMAACQLASAGPPQPAQPVAAAAVTEYTQRKIFVSNVGPEIDPQALTQFFAKYGEIEEGPLGLDKNTGKAKGFCLFVYKSVNSAKKALEEPHKNFEGNMLHCSKAIDGPKTKVQNMVFGGSQYPGSESGGGIPGAVTSHLGGASGGHLMAPPVIGLGFNQVAQPIGPTAALNPALNQALTAFIASQGSGLGLTNILGPLGTAVNPAVQSSSVTTGAQSLQSMYGNQTGVLGGNANANTMTHYSGVGAQMQGGYGQGGAGRGHQGRSGYMGR